ncbi:MAG: NUDIX hydrolase [Nanoarchaeota archaeon]|nr:NUDIX hydrolase [Nanoarchaeota archaeon]
MIYKDIPENFNPRHEAVGCFCQLEGKMLLLLRQDWLPEGNKWGAPGGKIDPEDKTPVYAARRELWEETGILLPEDNFIPFCKFYVRYPDYDFTYEMFSIELEKPEAVIVTPKEHKGFYWARPHTSLKMRLVLGMDECIRQFYRL